MMADLYCVMITPYQSNVILFVCDIVGLGPRVNRCAHLQGIKNIHGNFCFYLSFN